MKKFLALFVVAVFSLVVLLFITNPDLLDKVWLWIIGFIGYILVLAEKGFKTVSSAFKKAKETEPSLSKESISSFFPTDLDKKAKEEKIEEKILKIEKQLKAGESSQPLLSGHNLTVLRYLDDGVKTLGLIFLGYKFFAYTLEDTQDEKDPGAKRIPEGIYPLGFSRDQSWITKEYREIHPWFDDLVEIKNTGFEQAYILDGNISPGTRGSLLLTDGVNAYETNQRIFYSSTAFEKFYKTVKALLKAGNEMHLHILNEDWCKRSQLAVNKKADALVNH